MYTHTFVYTCRSLRRWEQIERWNIEKLEKKWKQTEGKSESWMWRGWAVGDRRAESQTDKERGCAVFKWPNQGTSPSKAELVCECVCLGRESGGGGEWRGGGCTLTDWVQVPLQLSTYPYSLLLFSPSSPERPKLLYPSTTHSGLNKAAPRLPTRTHTRTHILHLLSWVNFLHKFLHGKNPQNLIYFNEKVSLYVSFLVQR